MNENSTHTEMLIQYIDGELHGEELESMKKALSENEALREETENLRIAKEGIRSYGMKTRISSIHAEMMHDLTQSNTPKAGILKMIIQNGLRAAAVLIVLVGLSALYQYMTATPAKLFAENYHPYILHETRGLAGNSLADAYQKGDMDSVIWKFNSMSSHQPEEYLLAGIAFLENNLPAKAIETFHTLMQKNISAKTDYFEEDAEYYLAMSYLSSNDPGKAMPLFEKIQADPNHPYNNKVSEWFLLKVKSSIIKK
jgi:hypothetical protein